MAQSVSGSETTLHRHDVVKSPAVFQVGMRLSYTILQHKVCPTCAACQTHPTRAGLKSTRRKVGADGRRSRSLPSLARLHARELLAALGVPPGPCFAPRGDPDVPRVTSRRGCVCRGGDAPAPFVHASGVWGSAEWRIGTAAGGRSPDESDWSPSSPTDRSSKKERCETSYRMTVRSTSGSPRPSTFGSR